MVQVVVSLSMESSSGNADRAASVASASGMACSDFFRLDPWRHSQLEDMQSRAISCRLGVQIWLQSSYLLAAP